MHPLWVQLSEIQQYRRQADITIRAHSLGATITDPNKRVIYTITIHAHSLGATRHINTEWTYHCYYNSCTIAGYNAYQIIIKDMMDRFTTHTLT